MEKIGFNNLRSLENTGLISLKPINFLVGINNSGKSTFLRTFPLMRQSVESRIIGPLLWYGSYVDFGSFEDTLYSASENKQISFNFNFNIRNAEMLALGNFHFNYYYLMEKKNPFNHEININAKINIASGTRNNSLVKSFELQIEDNIIQVEIDANKVESMKVNNTSCSSFTSELLINPASQGFLPTFVSSNSTVRGFDRKAILNALYSRLMDYHFPTTSEETIISLILSTPLDSSEEMLKHFKNYPQGTKTWKKNVQEWDLNSSEFKRIRDLFFVFHLSDLTTIVNSYLHRFSENIRYIAPVRASAERYYRMQNLAVDEIDHRGQNLAMFLSNLTVSEKKGFEKWTNELFGVKFLTVGKLGQLSITVNDNSSTEGRNLTDTGFGYSQILPIITQLWFLEKNRSTQLYRSPQNYPFATVIPITYAIEQPELHLHPSMQSKLVDAFVDTITRGRDQKKDIRLIIETHSESIINKMGHLIHEQKINPQDVNVLIFEPNEKNQNSDVRISSFDSDGYLTNWPIGFFEPEI